MVSSQHSMLIESLLSFCNVEKANKFHPSCDKYRRRQFDHYKSKREITRRHPIWVHPIIQFSSIYFKLVIVIEHHNITSSSFFFESFFADFLHYEFEYYTYYDRDTTFTTCRRRSGSWRGCGYSEAMRINETERYLVVYDLLYFLFFSHSSFPMHASNRGLSAIWTIIETRQGKTDGEL